MEVSKSLLRKKRKEDVKTLTDSSSAHRRSQGKCQRVQTSRYIKRFTFYLVCYKINILLTKLISRYLLENLDLARRCVQTSPRSVLGQNFLIQTSYSVNKS